MSIAAPAKSAPLLHLGHPDHHITRFAAPDVPSPEAPHKKLIVVAAAGGLIALVGQRLDQIGASAVTPDVALPWVLPFVLLLACIATMPFIARHFWEKHYHHVAIGLAALVTVYYLFLLPAGAGHAGPSMARSFSDYISFIFLLGSLFTVSGGILIHVRRKATPSVNTLLLLTGAILANVFGTTGAAMLLIRPYLRINKGHLRPFHIVFFIFLVANVGGTLTPIGDPPLFLGYLKGVPFWWVFHHCWPMWCVAVSALLVIFFVMDTRAHAGQERLHHDPHALGPAISLYGAFNLLLVFAILAGVLLHDDFNAWWSSLHVPFFEHLPLREWVMVMAIVVSLWTTPQRIHSENVFNFAPIKEVALLFIGIFATMVPALNYLSLHAGDPAIANALRTPGQFYYSSGAFSSVLDNAPTYVTFLETRLGKLSKDDQDFIADTLKMPGRNRPAQEDFKTFETAHADRFPSPQAVADFESSINAACDALVIQHPDNSKPAELSDTQIGVAMLLSNDELGRFIIAVSLGSVFFGAMTYIGNGPNFMVKSIAESAGARCPSFFGYILFYSLPILLPVLILVWGIFLRPHSGG